VRFLVDAQLPPSLAVALSEVGHPSVPLRDVGLREADDEIIWEYAGENGLVIVTKDEDFAIRVWRTPAGPAVLWLRMGNCSNEILHARLLSLLENAVTRIEQGDRLVEVG
jgi:predicted nuclease of predicted toxin-antitoxin system